MQRMAICKALMLAAILWLMVSTAVADKPDWCGTWTWGGGADISRAERPWFKGTFVATGWERIEPENGRFDWSWLDEPMKKAAENGLYVVIKVYHGHSSPSWLYSAGVPEVKFTEKLYRKDGYFGNRCPDRRHSGPDWTQWGRGRVLRETHRPNLYDYR